MSLRYDQNVVSPALSPSLFFVDVINEWPLWVTYWESSSKINHKHNVKLIKNLEVSIQSSSSKQIKIYSENFGKNKICFIVKNKYLITIRSCFVPVTIIRNDIDTKENSMQQNLGEQILRSLKDESKHGNIF